MTILSLTLEWEGRLIRLSYTPRKWSVTDHLEIRVDGDQPIPITETGYRSHFFGPFEPALDAEDILTFVRDWIEDEARSEAWKALDAEARQMRLF